MKGPRTSPADIRADALRLRAEGLSYDRIARSLGVARSTAYIAVNPNKRDQYTATTRRRAGAPVTLDAATEKRRLLASSVPARAARRYRDQTRRNGAEHAGTVPPFGVYKPLSICGLPEQPVRRFETPLVTAPETPYQEH